MKFAQKMAVASLIVSILLTSGMVSYITMANAGEIKKEIAEDNLENIEIADTQKTQDEEWLLVPLPADLPQEDVRIDERPESGVVYLTLANTDDTFFYENSLTGNGEHVTGLKYGHEGSVTQLNIYLDGLYETVSEYDPEGGWLRLRFVSPHEVYDKVLVIDPGHGGDNMGTCANGLSEKDVDLRLAKAVEQVMQGSSTAVYLSRREDIFADPEEVKSLAERSDADMVLSIHCMGDASTRRSCGSRIFYMGGDCMEASRDDAMIIAGETGTESEYVALSDIYGLDDIGLPAVAFSPGYLTNKADAESLGSEDGINEIALKLASGLKECLYNE